MPAAPMRDQTHSLLGLGDVVYAARSSGLYRSDAQGRQEKLSLAGRAGAELRPLALAAASGLLLAGLHGGVARSQDGGQSWEQAPLRPPPPLVTCLALSPAFAKDGIALAGTYADGLFRSSDGGQSWQAYNHGLFDHNVYCLALSPAFAKDGIAIAGTGSGLYRSENGGRLWQDLPMPAGDETVLSATLAPHFAETGAVYAGTEAHGLLRSDDSGQSWQRLLEGAGAVQALDMAADGGLLALVGESALLSRADGASWRRITQEAVAGLAWHEKKIILALADGRLRQITLKELGEN